MTDFTKLRIGLMALARPTFDTALAAEMAAAAGPNWPRQAAR